MLFVVESAFLLDEKAWTPFDFQVDFGDIFANDTDGKELEAAEKKCHSGKGSPTRDCKSDELAIQYI